MNLQVKTHLDGHRESAVLVCACLRSGSHWLLICHMYSQGRLSLQLGLTSLCIHYSLNEILGCFHIADHGLHQRVLLRI